MSTKKLRSHEKYLQRYFEVFNSIIQSERSHSNKWIMEHKLSNKRTKVNNKVRNVKLKKPESVAPANYCRGGRDLIELELIDPESNNTDSA